MNLKIIIIILIPLSLLSLVLSLTGFIGYETIRELVVLKKFPAKEAVQGVIVSPKKIYVVDTKRVGIYDLEGNWQKTVRVDFDHLNSGVFHKGMLYLTNNQPYNSTIEIFFPDMIHHRTIDIAYPGSLTWISYYNGKWHGYLGFTKEEAYKSRFIRFNQNWEIEQSWKIDQELLDVFYPWSSSGGHILPDGEVMLTGHDKKELYFAKLDNEDGRLIPTLVQPIPFPGQGISVQNDLLYGVNRNTKEVVVAKLYLNKI